MERFITTIVFAMFCEPVILSARGGAKKDAQDAEGQAEARGNAPGGYLMPATSANNFCGDFTTMTPSYGYLMPKKGLFLKIHDIRGTYGINIYVYVMDGNNIQCTPGHFVMMVPKGGDKLEIIIKRSPVKSTPSLIFISTPDRENSAYMAAEKVAGKYYYLCDDAEARYKFEDSFKDERCTEFKNLMNNYGK